MLDFQTYDSQILIRNEAVSLLICESLLSDDVFASLRCIEVDGQFNSLGLVHSQRQVGFFLKVLKSESLQVLLSEGL